MENPYLEDQSVSIHLSFIQETIRGHFELLESPGLCARAENHKRENNKLEILYLRNFST